MLYLCPIPSMHATAEHCLSFMEAAALFRELPLLTVVLSFIRVLLLLLPPFPLYDGSLLCPLSSDRQHLSYDDCLEVRGEIIGTVLCCIVY